MLPPSPGLSDGETCRRAHALSCVLPDLAGMVSRREARLATAVGGSCLPNAHGGAFVLPDSAQTACGVLIVDESDDSREVLHTALQRAACQRWKPRKPAAASNGPGAPSATDRLDLETMADEDDVIRQEYAAALRSPAANRWCWAACGGSAKRCLPTGLSPNPTTSPR